MMNSKLITATGFALMLSACASSMNDNYPQTSADGLERIASKNVDAVYWQDGASLNSYTSVLLTNVDVQFRKNWLRDQNIQKTGLSNRIRQEDMDDISAALSELFLGVFATELESGGYQVVREHAENVLVLKASIVDLDVNAPASGMRQVGSTATYTTSAGEMTLNMELYDSATRALIGRVFDRQKDFEHAFMTRSSSVTNRAEAIRAMRRWAVLLRDALDEAKEIN